jgi:O-antigen ligase
MFKNIENLQNNKHQFILSLFFCAIPPSMVAGAAVMELFIFLSCIFFFFLNSKKVGLDYYKNKIFIIFIVYCFFLIFSSILSENIPNSLRNTMFYFRFGVLVLVMWYLLDNFKRFKFLFFAAVTITMVALIIYTILELTILEHIANPSRISGLFGEEKIQGSYLLRITPIYIIFYFYNKESLNNNFAFLYYIILLAVFILIILSGERAAIFLMIMGIFLSFFFLKINFKKSILYTLLVFLFFGLMFKFYPLSKKRIIDRTMAEIFLKSDKRVPLSQINIRNFNLFSEGHQTHLESAFIMFKKNYIIGVGVRNFRVECKKDDYKAVGRYHCSTHPHNIYMQILSETGLIGFLFFMMLLVFIFLKMYEFLREAYLKNQKINIPLAVCFIAILINFFPLVPTGSFFNNWLSTLYFIPIGLLLHEINNKKIIK